jgi:hypothetical protein
MCADGSTTFIWHVRSHSPRGQHHNPEDLRPRKQCCENIESHIVHLRPSFNIRPGHMQIVAHKGALGQFCLLSIISPMLHTRLLIQSIIHSSICHGCYIILKITLYNTLIKYSSVSLLAQSGSDLNCPELCYQNWQFSARVIFNQIELPAPTPNLEDQDQQLACCQLINRSPLSCQKCVLIKYCISVCLSIPDSVSLICNGLSYMYSHPFLFVVCKFEGSLQG